MKLYRTLACLTLSHREILFFGFYKSPCHLVIQGPAKGACFAGDGSVQASDSGARGFRGVDTLPEESPRIRIGIGRIWDRVHRSYGSPVLPGDDVRARAGRLRQRYHFRVVWPHRDESSRGLR